MQGKYSSDHTPVLSEQVTVVLTTHNRPAFLRRALRYYSSLPCKILVLDSSAQPFDDLDCGYTGVDYRHLPQFSYWGIQAKLSYGVNNVTTPCMVMAADDDFIVHDALFQATSFLQANPDYGMCHGYGLMYLARAKSVTYYRRDKKVCEDYASERAEDRVLDYMGQFLPPFYAVVRTQLMRDWYAAIPEGTSFEWQEIGHTYYLLACAKARILPIPYVVREINYGSSQHGTDVMHALAHTDAKSVAEREAFAGFLAGLPTGIRGLDHEQTRQFALESFAAMKESLQTRNALSVDLIIESTWSDPLAGPERRFAPKQYVEMPFYNQAFFDQLTEYEFLLHAMPAGRVQLHELEGVWVQHDNLLRGHDNDTPQAIISRMRLAQDGNAFNSRVTRQLAEQLEILGEHDDANALQAWAQRLEAVQPKDQREVFAGMLSGRLLDWLQARGPQPRELTAIRQHLAAHGGGPRFGIMLLDLDNDVDKLQESLDSLLEGHCKSFHVVVFTTGEPPVMTAVGNTLHFVKVSPENYIDKLNQAVRQSTAQWLLLAEVGDQFTESGLLRASLELLAAPECRAVAVDEIQRLENGALVDVFRPGFNLDLLQSLPALTARHWLIRRDVLLEAGGYSADFSQALEFELLLRIIILGGMAWLAHLDEPLLICQAPKLVDNAHERQALIRHLTARGYKAQVSSAEPGTYQIDYGHAERPLVSIILPSQDNLPELQASLTSVLQRSRYTRYEVLIVDNASQAPQMRAWLDEMQQLGGKIRVLRHSQQLSLSALYNAASEHAAGNYLVLLAADALVLNPTWIDSLLNQAQRPEVGVVGAKLVDRDGKLTQAGLILGMHGAVGSAFVGEGKDSKGYLQRLIVEQNYSAVSATCLMIRKELYEAVGGLDQEHFAEAFGDVDLCLKVGQAGYLTVWTPQVQVIHHGQLPDAPQALAALRDKWAGPFAHDLAYNKNLMLTGSGFALGEPVGIDWAQLLA